MNDNKLILVDWFGLVWFGFMAYQPLLVINAKFSYILTVLFQTIQFSISIQFSSILLIDRTQIGATTPSL